MCNNYLPIENLRWAGIDRDDRKCNLCDKRDIGDEFQTCALPIYVIILFTHRIITLGCY